MAHLDAGPAAADMFRFCPSCAAGRGGEGVAGANPFRCGECGFTYFFNAASAVAVFLEDGHGRVLFIRRGREPAKGKLALAGGFTDAGETGEEATRREIREELGLELRDIEYVGTWPNVYHAGGFVVHVLDIFYRARVATAVLRLDEEEVSAVEWLNPAVVDPNDIAFPSMRNAVAAYVRALG